MAGPWFAGDPHGDFAPLIDAARAARREGRVPEAVVLLGDMDLEVPLEQAVAPLCEAGIGVWWVHGNHDCDRVGYHDHLFCSALAGNGLHARVVELGGVRVAGLGGVFRERIWYPPGPPRFPAPDDLLRALPPRDHWRGGLPLRQRASIFYADYERLWEQKADVLVVHEAPACHRHGHVVLDELAEAMGARLIVHGHHHESYRTTLSCGIEVMGVGLAGVSALAGEVLVEGKLDRQREGRWRDGDGNG